MLPSPFSRPPLPDARRAPGHSPPDHPFHQPELERRNNPLLVARGVQSTLLDPSRGPAFCTSPTAANSTGNKRDEASIRMLGQALLESDDGANGVATATRTLLAWIDRSMFDLRIEGAEQAVEDRLRQARSLAHALENLDERSSDFVALVGGIIAEIEAVNAVRHDPARVTEVSHRYHTTIVRGRQRLYEVIPAPVIAVPTLPEFDLSGTIPIQEISVADDIR